jgi:hypothetical protein
MERNLIYKIELVRIGSRKWTLAQITHLMALIDEDSFAASIAASGFTLEPSSPPSV